MASTVTSASADSTKRGFRFTLWHFSLLLVVIGLLITGYMSYNKLAGQALVCSETGLINCAKVENSAWARIGGIPTALFGFTAHVLIGTVLLLQKRVPFLQENGMLILFGMTLFFIIYHSYLIYVSVFILEALCPYCLAAATTMYTQFITTSIRLKRSLAA